MNQVERIRHSRSIAISRSAPTRPNSPREIALNERAPNPPSHSEMASKSKVRQTEIFVWLPIAIAPRSNRLIACERLDLFEPLLQLLVVVAQLVDVFAQSLPFLDARAALADRRDRVVGVALDAAVEIAIGQPSQRRQRALIANLGEGGRDTHAHH